MKNAGLTTSQVAELTGHSRKQIVRYAKDGDMPGCRRMPGTGPGTGFVFKQSAEMDSWIRRHTLCLTARRNIGPGRKGRDAYESLEVLTRKAADEIRYKKSWDSVLTAITILSKQLPKKIRKMMSLYGCTPNHVAQLSQAMLPIWHLKNDVDIKRVALEKRNLKWN